MKARSKLAVAMLPMIVANVFACTTIVVGKLASANGEIMFGRNSDTRSPSRAKHLKIYPASAEGAKFSALPYYDTESGDGMLQVAANQYGVAMSATETITSSDKVLSFDPFVSSGVSEYNVVMPVMRKAKSAADGIDLIGKRIEKEGAAEGFGIVLADKNEAWYLETASGHHWAAVRIPDDAYFVSANQGRIQQLGIKNGKFTDGYKGSPDIVDFAVKNGFAAYNDGEFDFRASYQRIINTATGDMHNDISYNYYRIATLQHQFSDRPLAGFESGQFPTFLKPTHKLSLQDVESGLENYYQGTVYNPYISDKAPQYRAISVFRSSNSHVTVMGKNGDNNIANVEYIAMGMPSLGVYIPFYFGISEVPSSYSIGNNLSDDQSAFWKFRKLQTLVFTDFKHNQPLVRNAYDELQQKIARQQVKMEQKYAKTHDVKLIQQFTDDAVAESFKVTSELTTKLENHYNQTHTVKLNFTNADFDRLTEETYQKYPFSGF